MGSTGEYPFSGAARPTSYFGYNETDGTFVTYDLEASVTIEEQVTLEWDKGLFYSYLATYGVATIIFFAFSLVCITFPLRSRFQHTKAFVAGAYSKYNWSTFTFPLVKWIVSIFVLLACALIPIAMLLLWSISTMVKDNVPVGFYVLGGGSFILTSWFAFSNWRGLRYRARSITLVLLLLLWFLNMGFLVYFVTKAVPYTFVGTTQVFLGINLSCMILLVYLHGFGGIHSDFSYYVRNQFDRQKDVFTIASSIKVWITSGVLYLLAIGTLIGYCVMCAYLEKNCERRPITKYYHLRQSCNGYKNISIANTLFVFITDVFIYIFNRARKKRTEPTLYALLFFFIRLSIIALGERFWFLGHSVCFFILAAGLGVYLIYRLVPVPLSVQHSKQELIRKLVGSDQEDPSDEPDATTKCAALWYKIGQPLVYLFLLGAFFAEIGGVAKKKFSGYIRYNGQVFEQWHIGVGAELASLVIPAFFLLYRIYQRSFHRLTWQVGLASFLTIAFGAGAGEIYNAFYTSKIVLIVACCTPILFVAGMLGFGSWRKNPNFPAYHGRGSIGVTIQFYFSCFTFTVVTIAMGIALGYQAEPWWAGLVVAGGIMTVAFTFVGVYHYYHTLKVDIFTVVVFLFGFGTAVGVCAAMFARGFSSRTSLTTLALIVTPVAYLVLVSLVLGALSWRDNNWKPTRFAVIVVAVSLPLFVGVGVAVLLAWKVVAGIVMLSLIAIFYIILITAMVYTHKRFFIPHYARWIALAVVGAIIIAAFGLQWYYENDKYFGFTLSIGILALTVAIFWVARHIARRDQPMSYGTAILPAYRFHPDKKALEDNSWEVFVGYFFLLLIWIWGQVTVQYYSPTYVGLIICAFVVNATLLLTLRILNNRGRHFITLASRLEPGQVENCRLLALNLHLRGQKCSLAEDGVTLVLSQELLDKAHDLQRAAHSVDEYVVVLEVSEQANEAYAAETRFAARFYLLVKAALTQQTNDESAKINFALTQIVYDEEKHMTYSDLTDVEIRNWTQTQINEFIERFRQYYQKQKDQKEKEKKAEEEDEEGNVARGRGGKGGGGIIAKEKKKKIDDSGYDETSSRGDDDGYDEDEDEDSSTPSGSESSSESSSGDTGATGTGTETTGGYEPTGGGSATAAGDNIDGIFGVDVSNMDSDKKSEKKRVIPEDHAAVIEDSKTRKFNANGKTITAMGRERPSKPTKKYLAIMDKYKEDPDYEWVDPDADEDGWHHLNKQLFIEGAESTDIRQGELGDCWFLASIASVADVKHLPQTNIATVNFGQQEGQHGVYACYFHDDGEWVEVIVTDKIPWFNDEPLFAKSTHVDEGWVAIIEKAYAKLHGSYNNIAGGFIHNGLADLTGGVPSGFWFDIPEVQLSIASNELWHDMLEWKKQGHLLGAGSAAGVDTAIVEGIVQGHAYTITEVIEADGNKLLKMRNPHAKNEWQGAWSDNDTKNWTARMQQKLNYVPNVDRDDGVFWMSFDDFRQRFGSLYVCKLFDAAEWNRAVSHGQFDKDNLSRTYPMKVSRPTRCALILRQENPRASENQEIGIRISSKEPSGEVSYSSVGSSYDAARQLTIDKMFTAGTHEITIEGYKEHIITQGRSVRYSLEVLSHLIKVDLEGADPPEKQHSLRAAQQSSATATTGGSESDIPSSTSASPTEEEESGRDDDDDYGYSTRGSAQSCSTGYQGTTEDDDVDDYSGGGDDDDDERYSA